MASQKHFLQDRTALLLVSGNTFLTLVASAVVLLKLSSNQGASNFIVSYRSSLGINAFKTGAMSDIVSFILFALLIFTIGLVLSYRTYRLKRELSLAILGLTLPLLLFLIVIANSLLVLR